MKEAEELPINPLPAYPKRKKVGEKTWLELEECKVAMSVTITKNNRSKRMEPTGITKPGRFGRGELE